MIIVCIVLGLIFANLLSHDAMRSAHTTPLGQLILAGSVLLMAVGYWVINKRVEKITL